MKLEEQLQELEGRQQEERDPILELIKKRDEFIRDIEAEPVATAPRKPTGQTSYWHILSPPVYRENQMAYSQEDLQELTSVVESANQKIDEYIQRHLNEVKGYATDVPDKIKPGFWKPVSVGWKTFALANFLDSPVLGKHAHFPCDGHWNLPMHASINFTIVDTPDGIKPVYLLKTHAHRSPEFQAIEAELAGLNAPGYSFVNQHIAGRWVDRLVYRE